jgi:hypothetical protein
MANDTPATNKVYTDGNRIKKRTYRISNKTIIVIDESLVRRFSIDDDSWLIEEEREDGILLRIAKNGEENAT